MNAQEKHDVEEKILRLCNAASRRGISEEKLRRDLQIYGFEEITEKELESELLILESAGFIRSVEGELRPDLLMWRTTAEGDRLLMKRGLI